MENRKLIGLLMITFFFLTFGPNSISQEKYIGAQEAYKYVGQKKTVCGDVVSTYYSVKSRRQPTFLNLDQAYPNQIFTVVIWGSDRKKFNDPPEAFYKGKTICVTGKIESFKGKPEIIVHDPSQIKSKPNPTMSK